MALNQETLEKMSDPSKVNCLRLVGKGQYMCWSVEFVGGESALLTEPTIPAFVRSPRGAIKKALGDSYVEPFHFDKSGLFAVNLENLVNVERRSITQSRFVQTKSLVAKFKDNVSYNLVAGESVYVDAMADFIEQAIENREERV